MARVLLVEDDDAIAAPLERALRRDEHDVRRTASGEEAVQLVLTGDHELVLLDLGLPDLDGLEVCRRVREAGSLVPVIMLTARGDELDRVSTSAPTTTSRSRSASPSSRPASGRCCAAPGTAPPHPPRTSRTASRSTPVRAARSSTAPRCR